VSDNGIGIPEEDKPRLFESFHRAGNTANIQGTGLGLSIVKNAVDLHRGKITFESKINKGTKFTVEIPITDKL
jgi:signal transduction histidine kinase